MHTWDLFLAPRQKFVGDKGFFTVPLWKGSSGCYWSVHSYFFSAGVTFLSKHVTHSDRSAAYLEPLLRLTVSMDLFDGYRKPQTWPDGPYDGAIPSLLPRTNVLALNTQYDGRRFVTPAPASRVGVPGRRPAISPHTHKHPPKPPQPLPTLLKPTATLSPPQHHRRVTGKVKTCEY